MTNSATKWAFTGTFSSGRKDRYGTPLADTCTGYFVTGGADRAAAEKALADMYAANCGTFRLVELTALDHAAADAARIFKRGGTKKVPVLG